MQNSAITIIPLMPTSYADFVSHLSRHIKESGTDGIHFMPFAPGERTAPTGVDADKLNLAINEKGWLRCWIAFDAASQTVVGHLDLNGEPLNTSLHRCTLALGVEAPYRGCGIGSRLMDAAIEFAKAQPLLHWVDLYHFSNNSSARALYVKKGFTEIGLMKDRFRINGASIDDVSMTLNVKQ